MNDILNSNINMFLVIALTQSGKTGLIMAFLFGLHKIYNKDKILLPINVTANVFYDTST